MLLNKIPNIHKYTIPLASLPVVFTYDWITDHSGLRPGHTDQIELARNLGRFCVFATTWFFYVWTIDKGIKRYLKFRDRDQHDVSE